MMQVKLEEKTLVNGFIKNPESESTRASAVPGEQVYIARDHGIRLQCVLDPEADKDFTSILLHLFGEHV